MNTAVASTEAENRMTSLRGTSPSGPAVSTLIERSGWLRKQLFEMVMRTKKGHVPSSFSIVEILIALFYSGILRYQAGRPADPLRDRMIVSKGHAAMALYPILADIGFVPAAELENFTRKDCLLRMYADPGIPGIDSISGSLGHGLGIGAGMALAAKQDGRDQRSFVIVGDGECYEGSVWESALFASHQRLDNLIGIVDRNGLAIMGPTENLLQLGSLEEKFRSFGWEAVAINGHSYREILGAFRRIGQTNGRPLAIIANTVKGKGISFMENRSEWHNRMPDAAQQEQARRDLQVNAILD